MMPTCGQLFQTVYNILNNNITSPNGQTKWIFSEFPNSMKNLTANLPIVIISPVTSDYEKETFKVNEQASHLHIRVFSTKWVDCDTLIETIHSTLKEHYDDLIDLGCVLYPVDEEIDNYPYESTVLHMRRRSYIIQTEDEVYA